jgi:hypothetical protein
VRASSRIGGPGKAAQIPEEGNGSLTFREREDGLVGVRESKVSARSTPNPSHGTKMLVKNAACKESSREKSHIQEQGLWQARAVRLAGERWHSTDSGLGMAFIEDGA